MLDFLVSFATGLGSLSPDLDYISKRMDQILIYIMNSSLYQSLSTVFAELGMVLLLIYFLVDLMEKSASDNFDIEVFIRQLIKFVLGFAVMSNLSDLVIGIGNFVMAINTEVCGQLASLTVSKYWANTITQVNGQLSSLALGGSLGLSQAGGTKNVIFICIFQIIVYWLTWSLSISRAFKLGYKCLLAPMVCADIYTNGLNSRGVKHLKSIFALYFQSTMILLIMVCVNSICNNMTSSVWAGIIGLFVLANSIKSSEDFANDIVGH
jgi:hypothetical protein